MQGTYISNYIKILFSVFLAHNKHCGNVNVIIIVVNVIIIV